MASVLGTPAIRNHIGEIRKALVELTGRDCIETVWGIGYRLQEEKQIGRIGAVADPSYFIVSCRTLFCSRFTKILYFTHDI